MSLVRIGDLARLGGVSVRMLRHYHEIGLLFPDNVDPHSGYRFYQRDQLTTLREIATLKNLGLSLAETHQIVNGQSTGDEVRGILLTRRREAADELRATQATIERIDAHLQAVTAGGGTNRIQKEVILIDVDVKAVEARLVAQMSAVAESWAPTDIGPVIQPLYPELTARMDAAGVEISGPSTAWYEDTSEGRILVHATLTIAEAPIPSSETLGFEITELPALDLVASTIHRGSMDNGDTTYEALLEWIEKHSYVPVGYGREIDIKCGPGDNWIVELQVPIKAVEQANQ